MAVPDLNYAQQNSSSSVREDKKFYKFFKYSYKFRSRRDLNLRFWQLQHARFTTKLRLSYRRSRSLVVKRSGRYYPRVTVSNPDSSD
uniref:Uncharacterized protein n=1 Tax=Pararge aegeria TaxID=116150 RepID=S4P9N0_9NEOP